MIGNRSPAVARFLSEADCANLLKRLAHFAEGGGDTGLSLESSWTGNLRWARNMVTASGDVRNNDLAVIRTIRNVSLGSQINQIDDAALLQAVRRAEHDFSLYWFKWRESGLSDTYQEPILHPTIWFGTTYNLTPADRVAVVQNSVQPAVAVGMLAAGYLAVSARGRAVMNTHQPGRYYPYTLAQYSVTVRDPHGTSSGWAGVDWSDWARIDAAHLSAIALDKCVRSRNPVAIEPGRYTTILEPQAVCDLLTPIVEHLDRGYAESGHGPFAGPTLGTSKIGEQLLDTRLTLSADPMDPDLGFPPFGRNGEVYHPAMWFEQGVLKNLAYDRTYGLMQLGLNTGLPNSQAFRLSGGTVSIEEMIATTKRGLIVTRFSNLHKIDERSLLYSGYTRDGLWLIENGQISKPVKNFRFTESPLFAFNQVEQLGVPQRVFHPDAPAVVPALKVRDFSFTSLADAV